jgi:hypothetical protein
MRTRKTTKKTAFVPRVVFRAAFVGVSVVPICAATACGSDVSGGVAFLGFVDGASTSDAAEAGLTLTVASRAFADAGDAAVTRDASAFDGPFVVAVATVGFGDASDGSSVAEGGAAADGTVVDGGVAREGGRMLGVAVIGFSDGGDASDALDEDALSMSVTMRAFGDR